MIDPNAHLREEIPGEEQVVLDGVTFRRGDKVTLRLTLRDDPYDRMLDGRVATIERIYVDWDERVHLAVVIDDDPARDLMRDTGRYHFFKPQEVELA